MRRLGISSWSYPWEIGMAGYPSPLRPMRLSDLLTRASELNVGVVQIADNLPLAACDPSELQDAACQAKDLGLTIEVGTRGVEPELLLRYLEIALVFNARLVRTLVSQPGRELSLEHAEEWLRLVLPEFAARGVALSLENYEAHTSVDLASLVRRLESDAIGISLDTVNSFGRLETMAQTVQTLAPLTINLHIKDFVIERVPTKMGFVVRGTPAGTGLLNIPWVLEQMPSNKDISVILEQWPPFESSVEASLRLEREWAERGVQYLRACGCC